jgi:DNA topoisomerase II
MTSRKQYEKKDPIDHCIQRPDMYVGSTRIRKTLEYITEKNKENLYTIFQKQIKSSPALVRIFIEVLSNAIDNVERSRKTKTPCTTIKVEINKETGLTTVWNDGDIVPIEINKKEKCYNHTLIFFQLLTGNSFNDEEKRIIAGRNGLGVKLCNIFSESFEVQGSDPVNGKILTQKCSNNMKDIDKPVIKTYKKKIKGYTKISWTPDFKQFGVKGYSEDIIKLYNRYVIDASMISKVRVYFNGELIPVKNLTHYSKLYSNPTDETLYIKTKTSEILLTPCTEFESISFVNGVYTRLGGEHVNSWSEAIFRPIVTKFNGKSKKKTKSPKININDVKQFFRLFVVCTVIRPEFDGQDKNKLESPTVEAIVKRTHINSVLKWSVMDDIENIIRSKEMFVLKKIEKKKRNVKIDGLDSANNAGGKFSDECSLFVCEGLSAKTYVVAGVNKGVFGKKGRDWFGILPVTGKLLNVRNATPTSIAANKVIISFIQTVGLKQDCDYSKKVNFKTLNYGKVIIVADADVDGIHIEGLIINLIHCLFPSLLERKDPYVISMKTPIARVFVPRKKDILFYDERKFIKYIFEQTKKVNAKYYKGLGTTKAEDVPDTFGLKMVEYVKDDKCTISMNKIFNKKFANERKKWLEEYNPNNYDFSLDEQDEISKMSISNFLNKEMIKFSHADCARSIPNGIDGLKESQRKILYAVFKRNLNYGGKSLKVAQLSGYTAEHSNYHHGEQNLQDTIIHMATSFPGSNNIPILYPDGGFGTRLEGGKDAASARYIYTKMEELTKYIFRKEDEPLLTQINDDGDLVQPEHYIPIIPMILVNGCTAGIGTGWSCNVPCYNPLDLIQSIKAWLDNDGEVLIENPDTNQIESMLPEISPWYRGFKGDIEKVSDNKFVTKGIVIKVKRNVKEITELPISLWTNKFKEHCEDLINDKKIKSMKNYSTTNHVKFILNENNDNFCDTESLKLRSYVYTSNMVLFNEKTELKKYNTTDEIIDTFCKTRLDFYVRRKKYQIQNLKNEICYLSNKQRFISEIISKKLIIMNKKESIVIDSLISKKYDKHPEHKDYNYLLQMPVRVFTEEKILALKNNIENLKTQLETLIGTEEKTLWVNELDEFEKHYTKWLKDMEKRENKE